MGADAPPYTTDRASPRPEARGKFLSRGTDRLDVRGFTYGPFAPGDSGEPFPEAEVVEADLSAMVRAGANALRVYTVPPRWLLDAAERHGLGVMVGIPWEQHVAFLDESGLGDAIERRVGRAVRSCAGHPAVLCYAVGNEIPATVVRWTGRRRVERHLERLYRVAKEEDPDALVTYVNYPSTEYLELDFLDLVAFNVYLERVDRFEAYLKRLQNLAGDRPLLMAEVGLDARSHGDGAQAWGLAAQLAALKRGGCAGGFVFSWTDEWHAGGEDITAWRFGVTDGDRRPKPALTSVRRAFAGPAVRERAELPKVSVVICAYNAAATLADCLEGATGLDYPDYEVIVVDDGSTDATAAIAERFPGVRVISTPNRGLSHARNRGLEAASGEIIAYTDADARPEPDWLTWLAAAFADSDHAGIGGPNIAPADDGPIADCVAHAPGGPIHVLLSDDEAEHIPGCNMAFRREALEAIGGFDPRFRIAGDDVDVCWRIQQAGMTLGFSPAAVVWHHPRDTIGAYWRQQAGYGRAEALLEEKWPDKYNGVGHVTWGGRVYRDGRQRLFGRTRIYHGVWGEAPFQTAEPATPGVVGSLAATPEWYLVLAGLLFLGLLGLTWRPLQLAFPLLALASAPVAARAVGAAARARFPCVPHGTWRAWKRRLVTALLHVLQPAARLRGRLRYGLTPWRLRSTRRFAWPVARRVYVWSESWKEPHRWVAELDRALRRMRATVMSGGAFDRWDLLVKSGLLGRARAYTCVEEHGNGQQFVRLRFVPRISVAGTAVVGLFAGLGIWALADGAGFAGAVLLGAAVLVLARMTLESGAVLSACLQASAELAATDVLDVAGGTSRAAAQTPGSGRLVAASAGKGAS